MADTDFIVDHENVIAYYPEWAQWVICAGLVLVLLGIVFWIAELILKAKAKKEKEKYGLLVLRKELVENIKQCHDAEEEFRKILSEIDAELERERGEES